MSSISENDPRRPFIEQIARYSQQYPEEEATVAAFRDFVGGNPDCFKRTLLTGHVTGAGWVVDQDGNRVLLTHHRKLNMWLQLGGHADGNADVLAVAEREVYEESGLQKVEAVSTEIFDLSAHTVPARGHEPEHIHYDVRYAFRVIGSEHFIVSNESRDLRWVELARVGEYSKEASLLRMQQKWMRRVG